MDQTSVVNMPTLQIQVSDYIRMWSGSYEGKSGTMVLNMDQIQ